MKSALRKLAVRIDDMSLRERAMLFGAAMLMLIALPYSFVIQPALRQQKSVLERINRDQSQIASVQREIRAILAPAVNDPQSAARQKLLDLESRLDKLEQEIDTRQANLMPAQHMGDILRSLIEKSSPVRLVSLHALPGIPVEVSASPSVSTQQTERRSPLPAEKLPALALYRRGVELTLSGSYADLVRYLVALEESSWRILWSKVEIRVEQYPQVQMKVMLHTLGDQAAALTL